MSRRCRPKVGKIKNVIYSTLLTFQLTSALADLGGLTGLWIGASVVSLMEIIALVVYTIQAYVRKRKMQVFLLSVKRKLNVIKEVFFGYV